MVRLSPLVDVDVTMLDVEATCCYLGDMLCSGGDCDNAMAARCCVAWGKFRKPMLDLTTWHFSPRIRSKVYEACVHSAMLYGSEMWGPNSSALPQWPCHDPLDLWHQRQTKHPPASLLQKCGIEDITLVLRCRRLRWYGHVLQRAMSSIKSITNFPIPSTRKQGRPQKTWSECIKIDVNKCGLAGVEMHGEPVFDRTWCCQPHRIGHG